MFFISLTHGLPGFIVTGDVYRIHTSGVYQDNKVTYYLSKKWSEYEDRTHRHRLRHHTVPSPIEWKSNLLYT